MSYVLPFITAAAPYLAVGSQVLSAAGAIQQGRMQSDMYKLQADQARLKAQRDALQYEQQANLAYQRLIENNATAVARGFAGGVSGFTGSARLIQDVNEKRAGKDVEVLQEGARTAQSFGDIQAKLLTAAADQAVTGSYFDAVSKIGSAAYMYSQVYTPRASSATATTTGSSGAYDIGSELSGFFRRGVDLSQYETRPLLRY
jgi:hypothetical protein